MSVLRTLPAAVALALLLTLLPATAHAQTAGPASVVDARPMPGAVVPPGPTVIGAAADAAGRTLGLVVDGRQVATGAGGEIRATVDLLPGEHEAGVTVDGTLVRAWRFAASPVQVDRLAGADRVATAIEVARSLHPEDGAARAAVLARSGDFADALAGAPLAAALGGPLLLTGGEFLDDRVAAELRRVLAESATVTVLGGTAALSPAVAAAIEAGGAAVRRVAGPDRYATAAAASAALVADAAAETGTVVIASGADFPDALAASAPAARRALPILLTDPAGLPESTTAALDALRPERAIVVGGTGAVGEAVERALVDRGLDVQRLAGPTRYETALAVAEALAPGATAVGLVSGTSFADALSGGVAAAAAGGPLLLTSPDTLAGPVAAALQARPPQRLLVVGGDAAVAPQVVDDLHRAAVGTGGPQVLAIAPAPGTRIATLEEVVLTFDREVVVEAAAVGVRLDGREVLGTVAQGDFADTLVFTAAELPQVGPERSVPVRITALAGDAAGRTALVAELTYIEPPASLRRGDSGPQVTDLQRRLEAAGYWIGGVDGQYGTLTHQAVLAVQKVAGIGRDGIYGPATRQALEAGARPTPTTTSGLAVEVDKARQVVLIVRDGRLEWIFNSSTGTELPYTYEGQEYLADTPPGRFRITREVDGVRDGPLGELYRPKYFHPDGIAVHGSPSVPAYPASHGCVRVTNQAMDFLFPRLPIGTTVVVR